jgi:hypothetical protein
VGGYNANADIPNELHFNRRFVPEKSRERGTMGHVSRVTSVKTSVTINLGLNADWGQAAV